MSNIGLEILNKNHPRSGWFFVSGASRHQWAKAIKEFGGQRPPNFNPTTY